MSYLLARLRLWAAHHRVIWWTCAVAFAGLTGITVRAAIDVAPCTTTAESPSDGPTGDERGVALGRGSDPLPVEVGDRLDLWSVDDTTARGHLVVVSSGFWTTTTGRSPLRSPPIGWVRLPPPWTRVTCSRHWCPDWRCRRPIRPSAQRGGQQPQGSETDHHPVASEGSQPHSGHEAQHQVDRQATTHRSSGRSCQERSPPTGWNR